MTRRPDEHKRNAAVEWHVRDGAEVRELVVVGARLDLRDDAHRDDVRRRRKERAGARPRGEGSRTASYQLSEVRHVPVQPLSGFMGAVWEGGRVAREHE